MAHDPQVSKTVFASIARSLAIDARTGQVVEALRTAGIRPLLLKGPTIARWLYADGAARPYGDSDLLVAPNNFEAAIAVLERLGFENRSVPTAGSRPLHAYTFVADRDDATVDLHRSLVGVERSEEGAWGVLTRDTDVIRVGGVEVEALALTARALHVALHAAYDGPRMKRPLEDLRRAIEILPEEAWEAVAQLADELGAKPALAQGLRSVPSGAALAERLGLPLSRSLRIALSASHSPPLALGFDWLHQLPTLRNKAVFVLHKAFPPASYMRTWSPVARRGVGGLTVAYVWRLAWLLWRAPSGFKAWRRARRDLEGP
jgi:Uncharacterised nucleotidyltransferase